MAARNIRMIAGNGNHVVELAAEEAKQVAEAMMKTSYLMEVAGRAFDFLHSQLAAGYVNRPKDQSGLEAVLELCGHGMGAVFDREGGLVAEFAGKLEKLTKEMGNVDQ